MGYAHVIISSMLASERADDQAREPRPMRHRTLARVRSAGASLVAIALAGSTVIVVGGGVPADAFASSVGPARTGPTVYVANNFDNTLTPITTPTNTAGAPISIGTDPAAIALTPDAKTAYVANWADDRVTPIATASGQPGAPIPVTDPVALAITPDGNTLYAANYGAGTVTPIATATNTVGRSIIVGTNPQSIAITPDGATAYVANLGTNTVTPIATATNTAGAPIPVGDSPASVAITPDGAMAYVANFDSGTITPIVTATDSPASPIIVGTNPAAVALTPDGTTAYVANQGSRTVTPISTATNIAGPPIAVGTTPAGLAVSPDGETVYVADHDDNTVTPIASATNTADSPIIVGTKPGAIAITPDQAPVARFRATGTKVGAPVSFDARASSVAYGSIVSYAWSFGDATNAITRAPTITHTYVHPGVYTVTLTETDSAGTSTTKVFTGQTMSHNGGPEARVVDTVCIGATAPVAAKGSTTVIPLATGLSRSTGPTRHRPTTSGRVAPASSPPTPMSVTICAARCERERWVPLRPS